MRDSQTNGTEWIREDRATAGDVVDARRAFWQQYVGGGSGWFVSTQACDDLFDNLAREGALTDEWLKRMAERAE